jgi:hypothetical protein
MLLLLGSRPQAGANGRVMRWFVWSGDRAGWRVDFGSSAGLAGRLRLVSECSDRSEEDPTPETPAFKTATPPIADIRFARFAQAACVGVGCGKVMISR